MATTSDPFDPSRTRPRQVRLRQCRIWSPTLQNRATNETDRASLASAGVDISSSVVAIDVYESIFANTISAKLTICETFGYAEYFPLTGAEYVILEFSISFQNEERIFRRTFRVSRLIDQSYVKNEQRLFTLELVTSEFFSSISSRMTKRYRNTTCLGAVRDIMKNYMNIKDKRIKDASFENTAGNIDIVIPNYTPFQAINFFSLLAQTDTTPAESNFVFYETLEGFSFTSIRKLIADGKAQYAQDATKSRNDPSRVVPMFRVNANQMTGQPKIADSAAYNSIIKLYQDEVFDSIKDIASGMLRTKMLRLDFFARKWNEEDSRYTETFKKTTHLDQYPVYPENFDQSVSRNTKLFIVPTNTSIANSTYVEQSGEVITPQKMYESIVLRNRQMKEIQHLRTVFEVPGQPQLRAGKVVWIDYPSSRELQGEGDQSRTIGNIAQSSTPYHSGLHLLTHVRHCLRQVSMGVMEYTMHCEAVRDSFGSPMIPYKQDDTDVDNVDGKVN
jgi:hypothetical protein